MIGFQSNFISHDLLDHSLHFFAPFFRFVIFVDFLEFAASLSFDDSHLFLEVGLMVICCFF